MYRNYQLLREPSFDDLLSCTRRTSWPSKMFCSGLRGFMTRSCSRSLHNSTCRTLVQEWKTLSRHPYRGDKITEIQTIQDLKHQLPKLSLEDLAETIEHLVYWELEPCQVRVLDRLQGSVEQLADGLNEECFARCLLYTSPSPRDS